MRQNTLTNNFACTINKVQTQDADIHMTAGERISKIRSMKNWLNGITREIQTMLDPDRKFPHLKTFEERYKGFPDLSLFSAGELKELYEPLETMYATCEKYDVQIDTYGFAALQENSLYEILEKQSDLIIIQIDGTQSYNHSTNPFSQQSTTNHAPKHGAY